MTSLGKILYFSLFISYINNARVIPRYVVLLDVIVNKIFKTCLISGHSLELSAKIINLLFDISHSVLCYFCGHTLNNVKA